MIAPTNFYVYYTHLSASYKQIIPEEGSVRTKIGNAGKIARKR